MAPVSRIEREQILLAFRRELSFFEAGGYGRPFSSKWRSTLLMRDSPACINYGSEGYRRSCRRCPFFPVVPAEYQGTALPCHHIPLDARGVTIAHLYETATQKALDRGYRAWLRSSIEEFEHVEEAFMQALQTVNRISFKNILYLTDFSEASETALAYAMGFARHFGAQIFPAHACDPIILTETTAPNVLDEVEQDSQGRLTQLAKKNGITGPPLLVRGRVEAAIPTWIKEHGIDLIVMGTHGRRGLKHFLLGSAAEAVFRSVACPVLTVGPRVTARPYHDFKAERILFPTDLGPHAEFATQYALSVAQESQAHLTLMHVISLEEAFQRESAALLDEAYGKLEKLVPDEAREWCEPEFNVEIGDPVKELVGYAETERPDLIVLGLPANKTFGRHFRAGVTYNIVSAAPCPVLTVRDITEN